MSKPQHTLSLVDKESLVRFLTSFYSIGQLELYYCTLTDGKPVPGLSDFDRDARAEAIGDILNKTKLTKSTPVEENMEPAAPPAHPLEKARKLASGLVVLLEDYCDKIDIAGSVRRNKASVKDIEIVCLPKRFADTDFSLFGGMAEPRIVPAFKRTVENLLGRVIKGKYDGRYMQIELPSGLKLDLFMPQPNDYYRQLAIRTGSADYSAKVIATGWKNLGWCGTPDGLRRISQCQETPSGGWKCTSPHPILPPVWQSEKQFFEWLQVPYLEPQDRI